MPIVITWGIGRQSGEFFRRDSGIWRTEYNCPQIPKSRQKDSAFWVRINKCEAVALRAGVIDGNMEHFRT